MEHLPPFVIYINKKILDSPLLLINTIKKNAAMTDISQNSLLIEMSNVVHRIFLTFSVAKSWFLLESMVMGMAFIFEAAGVKLELLSH